jgi:hypothetical protein
MHFIVTARQHASKQASKQASEKKEGSKQASKKKKRKEGRKEGRKDAMLYFYTCGIWMLTPVRSWMPRIVAPCLPITSPTWPFGIFSIIMLAFDGSGPYPEPTPPPPERTNERTHE